MGGVRECGRDSERWGVRVIRRAQVDPAVFRVWLTCRTRRWWSPQPDCDLVSDRRTDERLALVLAAPRIESGPCSGSSDLDDLFGLVGGPAAARLPLPALADVRTVTWPVGW